MHLLNNFSLKAVFQLAEVSHVLITVNVPHKPKSKIFYFTADVPDQLGVKTTQLTTETKIGHGVLPNKPKITTTTTVGPSVSPTSKPRAMDSSQVVDILFPKDNTSTISVKGTPSNPKKITLPRHSKEKLPPWEK